MGGASGAWGRPRRGYLALEAHLLRGAVQPEAAEAGQGAAAGRTSAQSSGARLLAGSLTRSALSGRLASPTAVSRGRLARELEDRPLRFPALAPSIEFMLKKLDE